MCIYCTDYLGRVQKKTVDSGYFWRVTGFEDGVGVESLYSLNYLFYYVLLGKETVENSCFLKELKISVIRFFLFPLTSRNLEKKNILGVAI